MAAGPSRVAAFEMELVQHTVGDRREQNARNDKKHKTGVQSVGRREELRGSRRDPIDLSHPRQDHRGVQQSVEPQKPPREMISGGPNAQRERDDRRRDREVAQETARELSWR